MYLYQYSESFNRSAEHSRLIAWKEAQKAGLKTNSKIGDWHYFFWGTEVMAVISNVPLSPSKTHVHVVATSVEEAPAKQWSAQLMELIENSKLVKID